MMSHHHDKQTEPRGPMPECSSTSVPPAPEDTDTPEKRCSKVKRKSGSMILNKPRASASVQVKGGRRYAPPVKAAGAAETIGTGAEENPVKAVRRAKSITVDTSKAKTSLEALKLSIRQLKWKEFPTGRRTACDIYWHGVSFHDNENIVSGQVNKFPGMVEMLRKINLSRAMRTMQQLFPEEYNFYPRSWILPEEYQLFSTQILGFDILLMKNLKPVLLEVNANPSMRIEHEQEVSSGVFEYVPSPVDEEVKVGVIRDTLRLMDPAQRKPATSDVLGSTSEEAVLLHAASDERAALVGSLQPLCLKQVFPKYMKQFNYLRMFDRITDIFLRFLGVKGNMKLGPTGFRTFIRNCKLSNSSFTMASVDILYIDITRRWAAALSDSREAGMGLQAFVEAFFFLASRRFKTTSPREGVLSLLELCEAALEREGHDEKPRPPKSQPNLNSAHVPTALNSPAATRRLQPSGERKRGDLGS